MMRGAYESRCCPSCDRDFLYPFYGNRVCHDCLWTRKARWEANRRRGPA